MTNKNVSFLDYTIATFLGAGFFPKIPGTFASIIAIIPLLFIPFSLKFITIFSLIILFFFISIPSIKKIEHKHGSDASIIVIDEILGMWLIYLSPFIPITWISIILGLVLFRFFDIIKPGIIGKLNNKEGALYVLLDDITAGLFSAIILHSFYLIYRFVFLIYFF